MIDYLLLRDPEGASRERYIKRRRGKVQGFFGKKDFVARWTMKGERSWSRENREGTSARRETACSRSKITEREISKSFIQTNKIQPNFICRKKKKKKEKEWFRISVVYVAAQWLNFIEKLNVHSERGKIFTTKDRKILLFELDSIHYWL